MQTQSALYDSLFSRPIRKAALFGYLTLTGDARKVGGEWGKAQITRADRIAKRFRINDLVLQWRNARPVTA